MTIFIKSSNSTVGGVAQTLLAGDMLIVTSPTVFGSNNSTGVLVSGAGAAINVDGTLVAVGQAIAGDIATSVTIGSLGAVISQSAGSAIALGERGVLTNAGSVTATAGTGVLLTGNKATITNTGSIFGEEGGVSIGYLDSQAQVLTNLGTITAGAALLATKDEGHGLQIGGDGMTVFNKGTILSTSVGKAGIHLGAAVLGTTAAATQVSNEGLISAAVGWGFDAFDNGAFGFTLFNSGVIEGVLGGLRGSAGTDVIRTTGLISHLASDFVPVAVDLGDGNDRLTNGGAIHGDVLLGLGNDNYDGRWGSVVGTVAGGAGNDLMRGGAADDDFRSDAGNNTLYGGAGDDNLIAGGNDLVYGGTGDDHLFGGPGSTQLYGGYGSDTLGGGTLADTLDGGEGDDFLFGGGGDDTYYVNSAGDVVLEPSGAGGTDTIISYVISLNLQNYPNVEVAKLFGSANLNLGGNDASNTLLGNDGNNKIEGRGGDDFLFGQEGADTITGGNGNDVIQSGGGPDSMAGGSGTDQFVFASSAEVIADIITDFVSGTDKINLHGFMPGASYIGAAAFSAANQVRYDAATGILSGDVNGGGADWSMTLSNKPATLALTDFIF